MFIPGRYTLFFRALFIDDRISTVIVGRAL